MKRIGIQLDFAGGYGRGVLRGVMHYAQLRRDWEFVMPPMYSLTSKKTVDPTSADGVVAMIHSVRSIEPFAAARVPVVNTARTLSVDEMRSHGLATIVPDDAALARLAYTYFSERGFRSFGFCGHPTASWSRVRCETFEACCRRDGRFFSAAAAADRVPGRWLRSLPRPCAVLAANDRYAWNAIDTCREHDISVPEEMAVLGVDNDTLLDEMIRPTLSSIDPSAERIGMLAAETLDRLMKGKPPAEFVVEVEPNGVITRHSTDILNIPDEAVADSVRFIREHAQGSMGVEDVLDHVAMSRRNLERRFRRVMGRSLLDEIRRVRLDRACQLLRDTDLDMARIAKQSGFASQVRFSTVFREALKQTPTDYRRSHSVSRT
jgi:LacI family transcriptional regulator